MWVVKNVKDLKEWLEDAKKEAESKKDQCSRQKDIAFHNGELYGLSFALELVEVLIQQPGPKEIHTDVLVAELKRRGVLAEKWPECS